MLLDAGLNQPRGLEQFPVEPPLTVRHLGRVDEPGDKGAGRAHRDEDDRGHVLRPRGKAHTATRRGLRSGF